MMKEVDDSPKHLKSDFPQTQWSLVLQAKEMNAVALADFCASYWQPLYGFARRSGWSAEDAEDLIQDFFLRLLEKETLRNVRQGGKLRSFLLKVLKNQMVDKVRREQRAKRGGKAAIIPFDFATAESELATLNTELGPDQCFDRVWARRILEQARAQLALRYQERGKAERFQHLEPCLRDDADPLNYGDVAAALGTTVSGARYEAYRLRQHFKKSLREMVQMTLPADADVDEEMAHLMLSFSA